MDLRDAWDRRASAWIQWARNPDLDDDFWGFHLEQFLPLVVPVAGITLDVAAGEGRLSRELRRRGHGVVAVDTSQSLCKAAAEHSGSAPVVVGDAARLPLASDSVEQAIAFMCMHDFDDLEGAVDEIQRVLTAGGRFVVALLHPFVTGALVATYGEEATYKSTVQRGGQSMVYRGRHRPIARYVSVLLERGFTLESFREVADPRTDPSVVKFLHLVASAT